MVDKDPDGFITKIYLSPDCSYAFTLDADKMVTGVVVDTDLCFPPVDCPSLCSDTMTYPDFCALIQFYEATNGPSWTNNSGWTDGYAGLDCDYCNWHGVTCDVDNKVTRIDFGFQNNGLGGILPDDIINLDRLERLNLWNNNIYGPLPQGFWNMTSLRQIFAGT